MAIAHSIRSFDLSIGERVSAIIAALAEGRQRRKVYRQTMRELSALSSRELTDLGIHRSMITRVALEAAYGK